MNSSQPTEPAGGQPDEAPPSERWIGAESARAAAPGSVGDPEPVGGSAAAGDVKPVRARLAGALGLDAVRATLRLAGSREVTEPDTATDPERAPASRVRSQHSHLRLVPPSEPEPEVTPPSELPPAPDAAFGSDVAPASVPVSTSAPAPASVPVPVSGPAPASGPAPRSEIASSHVLLDSAAPPVAGSAAVPVPATVPEPSRRPVRMFSELGTLAGIVLIGTAAALGVDAVIGGLNGLPPAYLLVFLASPIWDLLPARLPARIAVIALDTAATVGVWLLVAAMPMQRWLDIERGYWRAEFAFGLACLIVGALHLFIALVLKPQRPQPHPRQRAVP